MTADPPNPSELEHIARRPEKEIFWSGTALIRQGFKEPEFATPISGPLVVDGYGDGTQFTGALGSLRREPTSLWSIVRPPDGPRVGTAPISGKTDTNFEWTKPRNDVRDRRRMLVRQRSALFDALRLSGGSSPSEAGCRRVGRRRSRSLVDTAARRPPARRCAPGVTGSQKGGGSIGRRNKSSSQGRAPYDWCFDATPLQSSVSSRLADS